jgi:hypothetical protein
MQPVAKAETRYVVVLHYANGRKYVEGRVLDLPDGRRVFHKPRPYEHMKTGLFSLDNRSLRLLMEDHEVAEIHFETASGSLYSVSKQEFYFDCEPLLADEQGRLHLPMEHWKKQSAWYGTAYDQHEKEKFAVEKLERK